MDNRTTRMVEEGNEIIQYLKKDFVFSKNSSSTNENVDLKSKSLNLECSMPAENFKNLLIEMRKLMYQDPTDKTANQLIDLIKKTVENVGNEKRSKLNNFNAKSNKETNDIHKNLRHEALTNNSIEENRVVSQFSSSPHTKTFSKASSNSSLKSLPSLSSSPQKKNSSSPLEKISYNQQILNEQLNSSKNVNRKTNNQLSSHQMQSHLDHSHHPAPMIQHNEFNLLLASRASIQSLYQDVGREGWSLSGEALKDVDALKNLLMHVFDQDDPDFEVILKISLLLSSLQPIINSLTQQYDNRDVDNKNNSSKDNSRNTFDGQSFEGKDVEFEDKLSGSIDTSEDLITCYKEVLEGFELLWKAILEKTNQTESFQEIECSLNDSLAKLTSSIADYSITLNLAPPSFHQLSAPTHSCVLHSCYQQLRVPLHSGISSLNKLLNKANMLTAGWNDDSDHSSDDENQKNVDEKVRVILFQCLHSLANNTRQLLMNLKQIQSELKDNLDSKLVSELSWSFYKHTTLLKELIVHVTDNVSDLFDNSVECFRRSSEVTLLTAKRLSQLTRKVHSTCVKILGVCIGKNEFNTSYNGDDIENDFTNLLSNEQMEVLLELRRYIEADCQSIIDKLDNNSNNPYRSCNPGQYNSPFDSRATPMRRSMNSRISTQNSSSSLQKRTLPTTPQSLATQQQTINSNNKLRNSRTNLSNHSRLTKQYSSVEKGNLPSMGKLEGFSRDYNYRYQQMPQRNVLNSSNKTVSVENLKRFDNMNKNINSSSRKQTITASQEQLNRTSFRNNNPPMRNRNSLFESHRHSYAQ